MNKRKLMLSLVVVVLLFFSVISVCEASLGTTLLRFGSTGPDVVELQTKLNYVGYNVGTADGIFGNRTKEQVIAFQTNKGLSADGLVGPLTATTLNTAFVEKQRQDKINSIINIANQNIGVRYQWGGTSPTTGFDCSGFTSYVFAQSGITLPRISRDQFNIGTSVNYTGLQQGDLVFFSIANNGIVDHVGIYLGNNQFINASSSKGVTIYTIGPYWQSILLGGKRVI
jgi:peptidoglycan DL-endopeptidase CwlO